MKELRFRQVHLDYHTSLHIPNLGVAFDPVAWQRMLQTAHVDSITCFSACHHGWSYHPTEVGRMHPNLAFNLLRAQIDASHAIDVRVPVYLSGGVNNLVDSLHPGWREIKASGTYAGWAVSPFEAGFHKMCLNSPYRDYFCKQVEETLRLFPDADGIFIDSINQGECCCPYCLADMEREGFDPDSAADRARFRKRTLLRYYQQCAETVRNIAPDMPLFHNSGHLTVGNREILPYFSHLELESLPTGGWGYDHFPLSAAYGRTLGMDFLGMTGKFHTAWGEFGGFKHPNALRYECSAMLAQGAKCSIGDQLHPAGALDESTYELIGTAYAEVEAKEPFCRGAKSAANVALLADPAKAATREMVTCETGASRWLLENHIFFDLLDSKAEFDAYDILILADEVRINPAMKQKLDAFLTRGGKLVLSGTSGMWLDRDEFAFDIGAEYCGPSPFCPDYIESRPEFAPEFAKTPFVMYHASQRIKARTGKSLGSIHDPYFNRTHRHFCSHQHAPHRPEASGFDAGVMTKQILYFAHPVFLLYAGYGAATLRQFVRNAFFAFAGDQLPVHCSLPSQGRMTLLKQEKRYILHLLYGNLILRGSHLPGAPGCRDTAPLEVIEELTPLHDVTASVKLPETITRVTLEPQGVEIPFERTADGRYQIKVDQLLCHQMVVFA